MESDTDSMEDFVIETRNTEQTRKNTSDDVVPTNAGSTPKIPKVSS